MLQTEPGKSTVVLIRLKIKNYNYNRIKIKKFLVTLQQISLWALLTN